MTRTAEIRNRLTEDPQFELWILDLFSRLPLEDATPDTPDYRFAETVRIPRARIRHTASEPWFDRATPTNVPASEAPLRNSIPLSIDYTTPGTAPKPRSRVCKTVNFVIAVWWRLTGRGTSGVVWSVE